MAFFPPNPHNTTNFMFHALEDHHDNHHDHDSTLSLTSFPSLPPPSQHFLGVAPFMLKRSMSFSGRIENKCEQLVPGSGGDDDMWDEGFLQFGEKKKRLNIEQVKALEKSFESRNKLEPERKAELAKSLGMQPRQIAIWFQNRRARWKTKHLEKEYEVLKKHFEVAKADHDELKALNQKLNLELQALKSTKDYCEAGTISLKQETAEGSWSNNGSYNNNSSDNIINLDLSRTPLVIKSTTPPSSRPPLQLQDEEGFCNMFDHHIDHHEHEQQNLWPWL